MYNMSRNTDKSGEFKVNIDLREETAGLINQNGIDILYVRQQRFVRCTCFDDLNKTGDPKCQKCFGSGYFTSIQKIRSFKSSNVPYSSSNAIASTNVGEINQKNELYYFNHNVLPQPKDLILKVTWKNGIPVDVLEVLEIVAVNEFRADNGRIELFATMIDLRTDLYSSFNKSIKQMPVKGLNQLARGGKYIWAYNQN